ncbi:hypothetical protein M409DRAFT_22337 [Zasmidium cellare ATCC 36951]|uniref:Zn(2)-C6 fungal-type domain-containing protein n=1 Tax=Zasmidium cellare ATCC 36951 TaxID=1080233 RepID=A0A6A6CN14_ZASCE|nr:uncharacterized protein M409DRAFT_22337 [Zasmidium cellare ATCC 36951]KAF2167530.1 hypothetical protein M409DRAFT_22337 [Zasmidium cellare ATCC 36951]
MPPRSVERPITTCRGCRRLKARCDRARPRCQRCQDSGIACVYEDQTRPAFQFVDESPITPERTPQDAQHEPPTGEAPAFIAVSSDRLAAIEARVHGLSQTARELNASRSVAVSTPGASRADFGDVQPSKSSEGHLSPQPGGGVRYVERTFWMSFCSDIAELDGLLASQARYSAVPEEDDEDEDDEDDEDDANDTDDLEREGPEDTTRPISPWKDSLPSRSGGPYSSVMSYIAAPPPAWSFKQQATTRAVPLNNDFYRRLPPKAVCDALWTAYFEGYHPIAPLVHMPSITEKYNQFWRTAGSDESRSERSMPFVSLMMAILYAGSVACPQIVAGLEDDTGPEGFSTNLHQLAMKAVRLSNFPRTPNLESFTAYIICQATWMREEEPLVCVAFVGLALRVAHMLGLHKDPSNFPSIEPTEAETRRRVWWHLVHIDVSLAIAAGLPPLVDLDASDVSGISELRDELIGSPEGAKYELGIQRDTSGGAAMEDPMISSSARAPISTIGILVAGKLRYSVTVRNIIIRLYKEGPRSVQDVEAIQVAIRSLNDDLTDRVARIPKPAPYHDSNAPADLFYDNNPALNDWATLLLSAFSDQIYCLLCHPILEPPFTLIWPDLAIQKTQSFLTKSAQLACISTFSKFQWSRPGNHQPLHAITVLLVDLLRNPHSPLSPSSRRIVDVTFALCGPSGGVVASSTSRTATVARPLTEGGREAWEALSRLRRKAWGRCGWDADEVWTRERAIEYCESLERGGETEVVGLGSEVRGFEGVDMDLDWADLDAMLQY